MMSDFKPEYSEMEYSPKDALALALACNLAYDIKCEQNLVNVEQQLQEWGFPNCTILDKRVGKSIDTQAFIAANDDKVLISFCGSESLPDWLTNFLAVKDPGPFDNGRVDEGFQDALLPAMLQIGTILNKYNPNNDKSI